jgi:NADH dehydrogenase
VRRHEQKHVELPMKCHKIKGIPVICANLSKGMWIMKQITCIVIGAGYAGINAVKAIQKTFGEQAGAKAPRLILVDKQPYHLRKVLLFKAAAAEANISIPLATLKPTCAK